ncbi:MAG: hypothetical protein OXP71_00315 [Candidatus Poribacteria bacterium]|nr:hypothetical protein [Candidatus Poribacteria bacterium]
MPRLQDVMANARQDAAPTRCRSARGVRCLAYKMSWQTRGKMPRLRSELVSAEQGARLQDAAANARQDAAPTRCHGKRAARCRAYRTWCRTRGKMPRLRSELVSAEQGARLQDAAANARQDATPTRCHGARTARCPPTRCRGARGVRCLAYKMPQRTHGGHV